MSQFKLTGEDKDNLIDLQQREEFKSLVKLMNRLVENENSKVLNFNLNEGSFAQLALAKSRADGCAHVLNKLMDELNRLVAYTTGGNNERRKQSTGNRRRS